MVEVSWKQARDEIVKILNRCKDCDAFEKKLIIISAATVSQLKEHGTIGQEEDKDEVYYI